LGIGTSSPNQELHVQAGTGLEADIRLSGNNGASSYLDLFHNASGAGVWNASNTPLQFATNGTERMRIDSSGNVGIGTSSINNKLTLADTSDCGIQLTKTGSISVRVAAVGGGMAFGVDGSSGNTERMRIDSSGNVGIGTAPDAISSNATTLNIKGAVNTKGGAVVLESSDESLRSYFYPASTGTQFGTLTNHDLLFMTNTTERMRIDSSGNLLVGKTSTTFGTVGVENRADGRITSTRSGNTNLLLNRLSSDGDLVHFYKDGSTVGSISSTDNSGIIIGSHDVGLRFRQQSAGAAVFPRQPDGSALDATLDLGVSNARFKDLHLSGSVNLGSTSSITESAGGDTQVVNTNTGADVFLVSGRRIRFNTADSEAMRIDSSGNLLVGTTDAAVGVGNTNTGNSFGASGYTAHSRSGNASLFLNRNSSDGDIAQFYKDGSTVGSIGTYSGSLIIGNANRGLKIETNKFVPRDVDDTDASGAIDLGDGSNRFKDLYLSGGAYLGGTAAANKLDDYEEGTFTPVLKRDGSTNNATITIDGAVYVKIGRMVHVSFYLSAIDYSAVTDGTSAIITGLPFSATNSTWFSGSIGYGTSTNASDTTWVVNSSNGYFLNNNNSGFRSGTVDLNRGMFTITYQTA